MGPKLRDRNFLDRDAWWDEPDAWRDEPDAWRDAPDVSVNKGS